MTEWEDLDKLKGVFDRFDGDQNGYIDRSEFEQLLAALGKNLSVEQIDSGFASIDTNGNGTIEFNEFVDWWEGMR